MLAALALLVQHPNVTEITLDVDGLKRTAWIYAPKTSTPAPVVFAWHGHGGNKNYSLRRFPFNTLWPEAISVYAEGTPTKTPNDPQGKRNGWALTPGAGNKDLKFFDALWAHVQKTYTVDKKHVFTMGHSNGGAFSFVLWGQRPDIWGGVAPCSAPGLIYLRNAPVVPLMFTYGTKDEIVSPEKMNQSREQMIEKYGAKNPTDWNGCLRYESKVPLVTYVFEGGHSLPQNTTELIARFFKEVWKS